jgi:exopolysaccharide biosynthesis polyprenyl glycosylphosphotransferase
MLARKFEKYLIFVSDVASFNLSFALIFWMRYKSGLFPDALDPDKSFGHYTRIAFILSLIWIAYFFISGLYRDWYLQSRAVQLLVVSKEITTGCLIIFAVTTGSDILEQVYEHKLYHVFTWSRAASFLSYWGTFIVSVNGFRMAAQALVRRMLQKGIGLDRVLVLGATEAGHQIQRELQAVPEMGWQLFGYVDENAALKTREGREFQGFPVLGKYADLPELIRQHRIGGIIISHESASHNEIIRVLSHVAEFPLSIFIVPDLYDVASGHFKTSAVHGITLKVLFPEHMPVWEAKIKRLMDIGISALVLALGWPVMALTALLVKLDSPGPVFYSQERIGQYGKRIRVHKFRTMRTDAESQGPQWATAGDSRVTRMGRILRRSRIDELPQLWCILIGDMSLVGPRPERQHFISQLKHEVPLYLRRLKMKPGLTGWAQVKHRYDSSIEDVKTKVLFDLWYFENMSISLDVLILLRTVWVVITGHGAQ